MRGMWYLLSDGAGVGEVVEDLTRQHRIVVGGSEFHRLPTQRPPTVHALPIGNPTCTTPHTPQNKNQHEAQTRIYAYSPQSEREREEEETETETEKDVQVSTHLCASLSSQYYSSILWKCADLTSIPPRSPIVCFLSTAIAVRLDLRTGFRAVLCYYFVNPKQEREKGGREGRKEERN